MLYRNLKKKDSAYERATVIGEGAHIYICTQR